MSTYTPAQIAAVVAHAGGSTSAKQQAVAVAIALAESGGKTDARNSFGNSHGIDRGLWQINSFYHPEVSDAVADNPESAAREVFRISKGFRDWHEWSTYKSGAYLGQMGVATRFVGATQGDASRAAANPVVKIGDGIAGAAGGALSGIDALGGFFAALGERGTWVRILQVVGGAGLIVGGALLLGHNIIGGVAQATPLGRAADVVETAAGK